MAAGCPARISLHCGRARNYALMLPTVSFHWTDGGKAWCCLRDDGQVQEVVCPRLGGRVGVAPAWLHSLTTTAMEPGLPAVSCTCNGWESRRD